VVGLRGCGAWFDKNFRRGIPHHGGIPFILFSPPTEHSSAPPPDTTLTIARIILIKQADNPDRNRYQEPLGYDPGVFNARLKA